MRNVFAAVILLSVWGGAAWLTFFRGGEEGWFLLCCLSAVAVYALAAAFWSLRGVEVRRILDRTRLNDGGDLLVTVNVRRRFGFPVAWLVVSDSWVRGDGSGGDDGDAETFSRQKRTFNGSGTHNKLVFLGLRREVEYRYRIVEPGRGCYRFQETVVSVGDLLGVFIKRKRVQCPQKFIVYPRVLAMDEVVPAAGISGYGRTQPLIAPRSGSAFGGIREYVQGDSLSRIHWKSSAKARSLKTKLPEPNAEQAVFVYVDGAGDGTRGRIAGGYGAKTGKTEVGRAEGKAASFEGCVSAAAGLLERAHRSRIGFGLLVDGARVMTMAFSANSARLDQGLGLLAAAEPPGKTVSGGAPKSLGDELLQMLPRIPRQATIVWITDRLDEERALCLRALRGWGRQVAIVYAHPASGMTVMEHRWKRRMEKLGCSFRALPRQAAEGKRKGGAEDVGA
jgi:uncharacterized protein (DUF58 family)